jgi:hypothetical protein
LANIFLPLFLRHYLSQVLKSLTRKPDNIVLTSSYYRAGILLLDIYILGNYTPQKQMQLVLTRFKVHHLATMKQGDSTF